MQRTQRLADGFLKNKEENSVLIAASGMSDSHFVAPCKERVYFLRQRQQGKRFASPIFAVGFVGSGPEVKHGLYFAK